MNLKIKRLNPRAMTPIYGSKGAACFDLHACLPENVGTYVTVGYSVSIKTGLAVEIPEGHVMLIFSRSGHGFKQNVRLGNCVGVIDSDYRGEICVKLTRDEVGGDSLKVQHGDRIAQGMLIPVQQIGFDVVDELSSTDRGAGGFGSTGL